MDSIFLWTTIATIERDFCMRSFQRLSTLSSVTKSSALKLQDEVDKVIGNNEASDYNYVLILPLFCPISHISYEASQLNNCIFANQQFNSLDHAQIFHTHKSSLCGHRQDGSSLLLQLRRLL